MVRKEFVSATLYRSLLPGVRVKLRELAGDELHVFIAFCWIQDVRGFSPHGGHGDRFAVKEQSHGGNSLRRKRIVRCQLVVAFIAVQKICEDVGVEGDNPVVVRNHLARPRPFRFNDDWVKESAFCGTGGEGPHVANVLAVTLADSNVADFHHFEYRHGAIVDFTSLCL